MNFLDKLERKYGKFSIPNLMLYIMLGQGCVLLITLMTQSYFFMYLLAFNPYLILKGQIWRLITYVFIPNSQNLLFLLFAILLYTYIGRSLEHEWGTFKLNLYYLFGMIFNILGLLIIEKIAINPGTAEAFYYAASGNITYYLNLSLFLAFATLFPDLEFTIYFLIPIKVKYLALIDIVFLLIQFINGNIISRMLIILSLLNFFIFFGSRLFGKHALTSTQRSFRSAQKGNRRRELKQGPPITVAFHKCSVCGKTELTDPDMEFRYCSTCNGAHEYCMEHLHNHKHIE